MTGQRSGPPPSTTPPGVPETARSAEHIPVLLEAVLAALAPRDDAVYVDGTFGGGGYSEGLLGAAQCRVFGIDRDPAAVRKGRDLVKRYGERLRILEGRFGDMPQLLAPVNIGRIAGIALDLGVSSTQLDTPERGFSFRADGPLDMRMSGARTERRGSGRDLVGIRPCRADPRAWRRAVRPPDRPRDQRGAPAPAHPAHHRAGGYRSLGDPAIRARAGSGDPDIPGLADRRERRNG